MMELDYYNKTFDEVADTIQEEADDRLRSIRQNYLEDFLSRFVDRQREWDAAFRDILKESQENSNIASLCDVGVVQIEKLVLPEPIKQHEPEPIKQHEQHKVLEPIKQTEPVQQPEVIKKHEIINEDVFDDPTFSNINSIKEFAMVQELLNQNRTMFADLSTNPNLKPYKNDLNLFIRTQINSISNSDISHLNTKTKLLTSLFTGQKVSFQGRLVDASLHPQGQAFSMDLAASSFVTVGTRLVNSVPAIAKSMATVINGIVNNNLPLFKKFLIGHLQERCPYLIPMKPRLQDFANDKDQEVRHKIACGYTYDQKSQALESDEKYLARMRSMVLIYACILIQGHMNEAWTWLASFLSLKPEPVISAMVLQAFLQESSKKMSATYGRQYKKVIVMMKHQYLKMVEEVTSKTADRQSFIKLKNLLSDDSSLYATPAVDSIFGAFRH